MTDCAHGTVMVKTFGWGRNQGEEIRCQNCGTDLTRTSEPDTELIDAIIGWDRASVMAIRSETRRDILAKHFRVQRWVTKDKA